MEEAMNEILELTIKRARNAQEEVESYTQEEIDALVKGIARSVFDNAELFAKLAVEESGMGTVASKTLKKRGKARIMWNSLKGVKSIGVVNRDEEKGIIEIAKPIGVIGGVQPCTNPIVTPMANAMNAIKCRNAIIFTPHPRTINCSNVFLEKVYDHWSRNGVKFPEHIIQMYQPADVEDIRSFMGAVDMVVATGGPGMVRSAYSSGRPSYGVGPGNVPCIFDRSIDYSEALDKVIAGRIFDNGIICAGEQSIIHPREERQQIESLLRKKNCYIVESSQEIARLTDVLFHGEVISKEAVGKSVEWIAKQAKLNIPSETQMLLVRVDDETSLRRYRKEKMFPVIALFSYEEFEDGVSIAIENLEIEGKGHTVSIHSSNQDHITSLGMMAPVSRVIVNAVSATTAGGAFTNGLNPTSTLGCGSWGNNSISENFYYRHCMNITRIAMPLEKQIPSDEELWG